jgi:hypothetical protein
MQVIHELPAAALSVVVAPEGQPGSDVKETGAAGCRIGHDDLTLVDGLGHVFPGFGLGQTALLRFHRVEADCGTPHVHAQPGRWILLVAVLAHDRVEVEGRVRLQHAVLVQQRQAGCRHAHHRVGLGVGLFCQQLGRDDAGRVPNPLDFNVGVDLVEAFLVGLELVGLQRCIDQQLGLLGHGRSTEGAQTGQGQGFEQIRQTHGNSSKAKSCNRVTRQ